MATANNESAWSTTVASNATADSTINSSDSQSPDTLDNDVRNIMAARARARADNGGSLTAGGTANALTVTTNQVLSAAHLTTGLRLLVKAASANTSATVTFAPDGLTARNIKRQNGTALAIGSIQAGVYLDLVYNLASTEWRCQNIPSDTGYGGNAAFSAHKNGTDQVNADSVAIITTFGTEVFDVGGYYNFNAWIPPAGIITLTAAVVLINYNNGGGNIIIYKNDVPYKSAPLTEFGGFIQIIDQTNGTDYYSVYTATASDTSYTIDGPSTYTYFMGAVL